EIQFNLKKALAVKDAMAYSSVDAEGDWDFKEAGGPLGQKFNANAFLEQLIITMPTADESDTRFDRLVAEIRSFQDENRAQLRDGLPVAHDLYEKAKLRRLANTYGMDKDTMAEFFNGLYRKIYEFTFRASKFRLKTSDDSDTSRSSTGKGLEMALKSMKRHLH
ncbi:MAG: hypothetical protein AAF125_07760, partial [Chloroflexota bacterium]